MALELELVTDPRNVHTPLPVILVELILQFSVFILSEYIIGKFDSTARFLWVLIVGPPADPRGLGHRCIDLFESKLSLYILFINARDHIRWLDKGH